MIDRIGTCIYCGQNVMVKVEADATNEEANREAVLHCKCDDAKAEQKRQTDINVTESKIKNTLVAPDRVKKLLMAAASDVGHEVIKKISITAGKSTYVMCPGSSGIKLEKTTTNKEVYES